MQNLFSGLQSEASNVVGENQSEYTEAMFLTDFPQFGKKVEDEVVCLVPSVILNQFISMANDAIQEERWFTKWRFAMGLYIAHYSSLYLRTYKESSPDEATAAATGDVVGTVRAATLGDASVTYDTAAITAATEKWGTFNATAFGQLLVTEARLVGMGGSFII
jgi:hypothetical protein